MREAILCRSAKVLTPDAYASALGKRVYALGRKRLTKSLNDGIPPARGPAWEGNSVPVLLAI
ncbi:hypothetical protein ABZ456_28975 [Streptomyces sp. NPDC005776]|uniref:hypothetical protein n=1 Tax=Streptomyces sp. NPDC005776 TaxID=3154676 RepID=UPI0033D86261